MPKKKIKKKEMSLSYVISLNKKKGMNLKAATKEAKIYMLGYTRAKKGSINKSNMSLLKDKWIEGSTMIYICKNKVCQLPIKETSEALKLIV